MTDPCYMAANDLMTVEQAQKTINTALSATPHWQRVNLHDAIGRIAADSISTSINTPSEPVSAMDGYAINSTDIHPDTLFTLKLVGTSLAGRPYTGTLIAGECVRIFTGAVIPNGSDSVIMQETVTKQDTQITFPAGCVGKKFIRHPGSDTAKNTVLLHAGKKITAIDCALLAANGIFEITVTKKLRIAFFSTGDELIPVGQTLSSGKIYDSNRYTLAGILRDPAYEVADLGVIPDDQKQLEKTLRYYAKRYDVIISTGGASVGEADFIHSILSEIGQVTFWKIAMKPGKPLAFGKIADCWFFGLPGNPVSVVATLQVMVLPALQKLCGAAEEKTLRLQAKTVNALQKKTGRQEYQRGILNQSTDGSLSVRVVEGQDSHQLRALSQANCFIILPPECSGIDAGQMVTVEPFDCSL